MQTPECNSLRSLLLSPFLQDFFVYLRVKKEFMTLKKTKSEILTTRKNPLNPSEIEEIKNLIRTYEIENNIEDNIYEEMNCDLQLDYVKSVSYFSKYVCQKHYIDNNCDYEYKGHVYNLKCTKYILEKKIKNLPKEDRDHLLEKVDVFRGVGTDSMWRRYMTYKRHAYTDTRYKPKEVEERATVTEANFDVLVSLFARMYTNSEIMQYMKSEKDVSITIGALRWFKENYSENIEKAKKSFRNDSSSIRLTHKSSRLEELQELYGRLKEFFVEKEQTKYVSQMVNILKNIKEEVEGNIKKVEIDINGNININHALQLDQQQQIIDSMHIYDLIIGRVAAKANKSPLLYISALRNSFYADVVGFGSKSKEESEIRSLPSDFNFNLDELERKYAKFEEKSEKVESIPLFESVDSSGNKLYKAVDKIALQNSIEESLKKIKKKSSNI